MRKPNLEKVKQLKKLVKDKTPKHIIKNITGMSRSWIYKTAIQHKIDLIYYK